MNIWKFIESTAFACARLVYLLRFKKWFTPKQSPYKKGWHSWDRHPWKHPWLNKQNLSEFKNFSTRFLEKEKANAASLNPRELKIGFVGNIANCMYTRAYPLRRRGMSVDIYVHPHDTYVMSQPWWEEYDGTLAPNVSTQEQCIRQGIVIPHVPGVHQDDLDLSWQKTVGEGNAPFLREADIKKYPSYLANLPTLNSLQKMDVLWATQTVYVGYLANKPYVVSQMGGDIWFEASRNDELGEIQRKAFANGRVFLVSNPWSFAHARRLGLKRLVYLPLILDEEIYRPGEGVSRKAWMETSGGDFFVLTSSRLDDKNKGSSIGLQGFAEFVKTHPKARLVVIGWGNDYEAKLTKLNEWNIADKIIVLPMSGKARLRDYLRSADVFIDQFVLGYYGAAGLEAMACGLPVIGRIEHEQYEALCETGAPPFHNVATPAGVAAKLVRLSEDEEFKKQSAQAHRAWFLANHSSAKWWDSYIAVLSATAANQEADFSDSPLNKKLSLKEIFYHAKGLALSPQYPNYGW